MNASACAALLAEAGWTQPERLVSLGILALINVMVIVGNCLVIAAVFCSSKLRSVTNLFIVSLAVADLLVGVAVLPFSATWEIFKVWIFGQVWCKMWLALDVWMCTASILNLCAISLDRYVAVTRPITYPSIMSHSRAKALIAALWVLSFVICFPPLVGLKNTISNYDSSASSSSSAAMMMSGNNTDALLSDEEVPCEWQCELTNETGYVVYSALGSFYIPMFVMLFFYWRIYKAAVRTTRAINQGFRTTKGTRGLGNRFDEQRLTLRIHRGRGSSTRQQYGSPHSNGSNSTTTTTGSASPSPRGKHERVKISVSYPSSENLSPAPSPNLLSVTPSSPTSSASYAVHYSVNGKDSTTTRRETHLRVTPRLSAHRRCSRRSSSCDSNDRLPTPTRSPSPSICEDGVVLTGVGGNKPKMISKRMGKRNIKAQVKRFRMETKAAKTLGIIVGGFICCWLPFFTVYLLRAFCEDCVPPLLFSILFWLGYCNSAINPLIYALFSKDFRFAFKRIICKCFCKNRDAPTSRRGSDGSQLAGRQFRSASYNLQTHGGGGGGGALTGCGGGRDGGEGRGGGCSGGRNNSLGDDSDPGGDPSDSR